MFQILKRRNGKKEKKSVWNSLSLDRLHWYNSPVFVVHLFGVVEQAGCCHCVFFILHISTLQILFTCDFFYTSHLHVGYITAAVPQSWHWQPVNKEVFSGCRLHECKMAQTLRFLKDKSAKITLFHSHSTIIVTNCRNVFLLPYYFMPYSSVLAPPPLKCEIGLLRFYSATVCEVQLCTECVPLLSTV